MKHLIFYLPLAFIINCSLVFTTQAQSERHLYGSFVPYQWEIYNTIYKKRYWDNRDNYDFITFNKDYTFKRRYQGTEYNGSWSYDKKADQITLNVKSPFQKTITLKVEKLSRKSFNFSSSEEDFKVIMYMEEGKPPKKPQPKARSKRKKRQ